MKNKAKITFHFISLFPDSFATYFAESILSRAQKNKLIDFKFYNPRDFVKPSKTQKWRLKHEQNFNQAYLRVDDKPFGGGPGMVIQAEPVLKAIQKAVGKKKLAKVKIIFFVPSGEKFTTSCAKQLAQKYSDIIFICGRYEGVDERVNQVFSTDKISIGDYVLTGGELPAMVLTDCIARQIDGVLGNFSSREEERSASVEVYTRPEVLKWKNKKYSVPKVLLTGNHQTIEDWRKNNR